MRDQGADGEGAAKYKRDSRRRIGGFLIAMAIATVAALMMVFAGETATRPGGELAPALAALLALAFLAAMGVANWLYLRSADELVWANNFAAGFWGFMVMAVAYPAWLILWFGRITPEPDAETLYLITVASAGAVYLWKKFR